MTFDRAPPRWMIVLGVAILLLSLWLAPAKGHGDNPDWMRHQRSPIDGASCCDPFRDCQPVSATDVIETADGWRLLPSQERIPRVWGQRSRDGRTWLCRRPDGGIRCFFYVPGTS